MPRRLDHDAAAAIMRAAGVEPIELYPNSQSPWRCRCLLACGHEVTPQLGNVRAGHAACGYCAGTKVDPVAAEAVMHAVGFIPLETYPGSGRPWRCRCDRCGNEVSPRYAAVASGAACRYCAQAVRLHEQRGQRVRPLQDRPQLRTARRQHRRDRTALRQRDHRQGVPGAPNTWALCAGLVTPQSRGTVRLRSANPDDRPIVDMRFLSHPDDVAKLERSIEIARAAALRQP
jgi:hypothetical protein